MRRLFWLALGVTLGVLVVRRLSRAAEKLTPENVASRLSSGLADLSNALRDFAADVRAAAREQEAALRSGAALDGDLTASPRPREEPQP